MSFKATKPPVNVMGKQAAQQKQLNVLNLAEDSEMKANKAATKSITDKLLARLAARK